MSRELPARPNLEHLKKQAKDLLADLRKGTPSAVERFQALASRPGITRPRLTNAQHVIAREYGFASWPKLKRHVESLTPESDPVEALVEGLKANDAAKVRATLERHPALRARINEPLPALAFDSTALLAAVGCGNREMIDVLLRAGADIQARSRWWAGGFGVLDGADPGLVPFLVERGAIIDAHSAARLGRLDRLRDLVSADPALVHARGGDGQTPLHFASSVDIAQFLLDHGADIDARDVDHESTPAQYMVRDRQEVARYLVARGCRTDVLLAAAIGDLDLVLRHLDADPTCLRMSVSESSFPKRDPRSGGTIYIWTLGWHKTAHSVAREFGHEDVFRLLMERSPAELRLAYACERGDEATCKALLRDRPDLARSLTEEDRRRVADAAQNNDARAVGLMLAAGWPVDARGQHDATALHWAAWHGNVEMVRQILRYEPPVELRGDEFNLTALGWALHGSKHGWHRETGDYAGTVEALLQAGATAPESSEEVAASEPVLAVLRRPAK